MPSRAEGVPHGAGILAGYQHSHGAALSACASTARSISSASARVGHGMPWKAPPGAKPLEGVQFHPESFMTDAGPALLANFLREAAAQRPPVTAAA